MCNFTSVDMETWHRTNLYHHYTEVWQTCLMTFNIRLDVTNTVKYVRNRGTKLAPALYYLAARTLCEQSNFRMGYDEGRLGFWDELCPLYPVMNMYKDITFHSAKWSDNYREYYYNYVEEKEQNAGCVKAVCESLPKNYVLMSILPFMDFESCSFSLKNPKGYLSPTIFFGKYEIKDGTVTMPLSFTFNHAVADGYHAQKFFEDFQKKLAVPENYLEV